MIELTYLLLIGFVIGLSGAMLPGPLLIYTIAESLKKGLKAGPLVIIGHIFVEVILLALIALGLSSIMTSNLFVKTVGIIGGIALVCMGVKLKTNRWNLNDVKIEKTGNIVLLGMFFSAFNPGFPIWWATAGVAMLITGIKTAGYMGAVTIVVGHWIADIGYFTLVAALVHQGRKNLLSGVLLDKIRGILAVIISFIGVYFIYWGVTI